MSNGMFTDKAARVEDYELYQHPVIELSPTKAGIDMFTELSPVIFHHEIIAQYCRYFPYFANQILSGLINFRNPS